MSDTTYWIPFSRTHTCGELTEANAGDAVRLMGWVEKLFVDYTGQSVVKGQPLLELYSPELVAAQEEYLTALDYSRRLAQGAPEAAASGARDLLRSARQRWSCAQTQGW